MKSKEKPRKINKKGAEIDPNWNHILQEPYCMIRTYRGLRIGKRSK